MKNVLIVTALLLLGASQVFPQKKENQKPVAPFSSAIMAKGTLYLSGQLPLVPETDSMITNDVRKATEQCMKNMGAVLKKHGLLYEDLVMVNIYMTNMDDYAVINEVYASFFKNNKYPARVAVQVVRLPFDVPVEISAVAVMPIKPRPTS